MVRRPRLSPINKVARGLNIFMKAWGVLGVLGAAVAQCLDMEKLDRMYYRPVEQEGVQGDRRVVGDRWYHFQEEGERQEFNANTDTLSRIDKILGLAGQRLEHVEGSTKIILEPFKSITLESEDGQINVGSYAGLRERRGEIVQSYTNGDQCDICKGKRWEGTVVFLPDNGPLELTGPVESSTCSYRLVVKGEPLGAEETYRVLGWSKGQQAPASEPGDPNEPNEPGDSNEPNEPASEAATSAPAAPEKPLGESTLPSPPNDPTPAPEAAPEPVVEPPPTAAPANSPADAPVLPEDL